MSDLGYSLTRAVVPSNPAAASLRAASLRAEPRAFSFPRLPGATHDQKDVPCCVSCAVAAAMEMLNGDPQLAPLFHYYLTRFERRGADADGNLFPVDGLNTLAQEGICKHELHVRTFTMEQARLPPTGPARSDGINRRLGNRGLSRRWAEIGRGSRAAAIRSSLEAGNPVVVCFVVPGGYPGRFLDKDKAWLDPDVPLDARGHAVAITGFSDLLQALHVHDSQGLRSEFDQGGGWWMGNRVVDSPVVREVFQLLR